MRRDGLRGVAWFAPARRVDMSEPQMHNDDLRLRVERAVLDHPTARYIACVGILVGLGAILLRRRFDHEPR